MIQDDEEKLLVPSRKLGNVRSIGLYGCFGARHILSFLGFLGCANVYAMRVNLSVVIVAMVNHSTLQHAKHNVSDVCPVPPGDTSEPMVEGEFSWDEYTQGLILGSFFWGYITTNLLGGRLAEEFGGKWVFGGGVFVTALLTLLTPIAARYSVICFIILRVGIGMGEGVTFPAMHSLMAKWVPPLERSRTSSFVYAGTQFGTVIALLFSGALCQSNFLGGWPSVFYISGSVGILWFFVWCYLVSSSPEDDPNITVDEKIYIEESLISEYDSYKPTSVPWKSMMTSVPVWAVLISHVCRNYGFYCLLTELPTYMKNILHLNLGSDSFLLALPYLLMWMFSITTGFTADFLLTRNIISTVATRRIFNSIGLYGPMFFLILIGYTGCNRPLTLAFMCLAVALNGATYSGYMNSHLDLAPNFAGTLLGITNTAASIPGYLAPVITGAIINGHQTVTHWQYVFWIAAMVFFVGNTIYIIFISGEEQPWNVAENGERKYNISPAGKYGSQTAINGIKRH